MLNSSRFHRTFCLGISLGVAVILGGCATTINWLQDGQLLTFDSEPRGAEVLVDGELKGKTPLSVRLNPRKQSSLVVRKEGFVEEIRPLGTEFNMAFLGNFISGGVFGSTTDAATDNIWKYSPRDYFIQLQPRETSPTAALQWEHMRRLRQFVLGTHPKIVRELVAGEGEATAGLLVLLDIDEARSAEAIATLRSLSLRTQSPLEFVTEVEKAFLVDEPRV